MDQQNAKKPFRKTFLANFLMMIGICILIYWVFFGSLSLITRHNDVKVVPNFIGMSVDSAVKILENQGFEIKVDSVFDKTKGLHAVVDQQPEMGARVKSGRIIFLTVNKANPPMVALPNLVGKSFKTIGLELKKVNLEIGDTTEIYDISVGTILMMKINGEEIKPGTKIPEGSAIDFVISKGLGDTKTNIPDLIGKTLAEALKLLEESGLNYDLRVDSKISDSATALIYEQYPQSRNDYGEPQKVWIGDEIEIRYKQDPKIEKRTYLQRDPSYYGSDSIIDISNSGSGNHSGSTLGSSTITPANSDKPTRPTTKASNDAPNAPATNNSATGENENKKRRPTR